MKRNKKPALALSRETIRPLASVQLTDARGGIVGTKTCRWCPPVTLQHSICDSCYNSDCCLSSDATACVVG
jgi:hypothetical protein